MTIKITTTEAENKPLELLFEFTDYEVPEQVDIDYTTAMANNRFAGGLQTNQINGIFLEPITLKAFFKGTMVMNDGAVINAKQRFDQLARLQGRPIKLFIENFKTICIIKSIKIVFKNMQHIEADITFQPHDFQKPIKPSQTTTLAENSIALAQTNIPKLPTINKDLLKVLDSILKEWAKLKEEQSTGVATTQGFTTGLPASLNDKTQVLTEGFSGEALSNNVAGADANNAINNAVNQKTQNGIGVKNGDFPRKMSDSELAEAWKNLNKEYGY